MVDFDTSSRSHGSSFLPCACANLRRAARAVTRLYNHELRTDRIEVTQFTLLMALNLTGETSQGTLGALLALDSTTLTRMLRLMRKRGWITARAGDDRRQRLWRLTQVGREKFQNALPSWTRAQEKLRTAVGQKTWANLGGVLRDVSQGALGA